MDRGSKSEARDGRVGWEYNFQGDAGLRERGRLVGLRVPGYDCRLKIASVGIGNSYFVRIVKMCGVL